MNRETAKRLARAYYDGDTSAWNPLIDVLMELGYPLTAVHHHTHCPGGIFTADGGFCALIDSAVFGDWDALDNEEKLLSPRRSLDEHTNS